MSETSNRGALAPVQHAPRRVPRYAGWLALIGVLGVEYAMCHERQRNCATVAHDGGGDTAIVEVCEREYHRTEDPAAGVRLADGHWRVGNLSDATELANKFRTTPAVAGDALRVLGQVARKQLHYDEALDLFAQALARHRADGDDEAVARDEQAIAGVHWARDDQPAALRALAECIALTRDLSLAAYCHLSAVKSMRRAGAFDSARNEFDVAQPKLLGLHARDLAWLYFERGSLEQDARRIPRAPRRLQLERLSFEAAIVHARRAELRSVESPAELGLAWTLADDRKLDEADRHLAIADDLDDPKTKYQRRTLHAELALRRGRLDEAAAICDQIYDHLEPEQQIDVSVLQTRIALARDDYARAEQWAQRGIDATRALRLTQPEVELRQWALWSRRVPYELMFVTRARAGRLDDAMATLDQWQGQAALDALSRPEPDHAPDLRGVANRIDRLRSWLPAVARPPQPAPARIADVARAHDLLALFVADDHLWRVTSGQGRLAITDLGAMADFEADLRRLSDRPTDPEVAARLGARLIPDVRPSDDSLRVVLDATLDGLPVAALRVGGRPVIAARPVIYAPSVSRLACRPPMQTPRPVVILGDAQQNLPEADAEARAIGRLLHAEPALGPAATAAALWAAGPGSLLHVAVHGDIDSDGGLLALAGEGLHALAIQRHQRAPELVVLSTCVSALSTGRDLADSLASAFLAAGATQVVATLRTVPDDAARGVMEKFYAAGGAGDPARALARVQRQLAADGDPSWPSYAVFGQDLCVTRPEQAMVPARARPR